MPGPPRLRLRKVLRPLLDLFLCALLVITLLLLLAQCHHATR